jgi:hypothetical protein
MDLRWRCSYKYKRVKVDSGFVMLESLPTAFLVTGILSDNLIFR